MADFKKRSFSRPSFGGGGGDDRGGRGFGGGGNRSGGFRGGGGRFGGSSGGRSQMFTATCAQCQKSCEVPFRPNGMKPVYCNECFGSKGGPSSSGRDNRDFGSTTFPRDPERAPQAGNTVLNDIKTALAMVNIKLDKIMTILNQVEVVEEGGDKDTSISEDIESVSVEAKKRKSGGKRTK